MDAEALYDYQVKGTVTQIISFDTKKWPHWILLYGFRGLLWPRMVQFFMSKVIFFDTVPLISPFPLTYLNLTFDGPFSDLSFDGGGLKVPPPIFICENTRKSNKIMHCVEKKII